MTRRAASNRIGLEYALILRPDPPDRERRVGWPLGAAEIDLVYEPTASSS